MVKDTIPQDRDHGANRVKTPSTDGEPVQRSPSSVSSSSKGSSFDESYRSARHKEQQSGTVHAGSAAQFSEQPPSRLSSSSSTSTSSEKKGEGSRSRSRSRSSSGSASTPRSSFDNDASDETATGGTEYEGSDAPKEDYLSFSVPTLGADWEGHRLMCMHAYRSFLLIGTNQGAVGVLDPVTMATQRVFLNHKEPISDTSCNGNEGFIGSSDKSGYIAVQNAHKRTDVWRKQMGYPIQSLALHPGYHLLEERPVICAGADKVFLVTQMRFLSTRRSVLLYEGDGCVVRVRWGPATGELVAWLTDRGIAVLHYGSRSLLRRVPRPEGCRGLELYPATLLWETPRVLLCGWGSWVQELHVREAGQTGNGGNSNGGGGASLASAMAAAGRLAIGKSLYQLDSPAGALRPGGSSAESRSRVCGLAPFGAERYLILVCIVEEEGVMRDLEVCVVRRDTLKDLYRGRIMMDYIHPLQLGLTFARYQANLTSDNSFALGGQLTTKATNSAPSAAWNPSYQDDLHGTDRKGIGLLETNKKAHFIENEATLYPPKGTNFFIVSVDTIIRATPCDEDDHVEYLLKNRDFEAAYRYALHHRLQRHLFKDIFRQLLDWYMERDKLDRVAVLLPSFIGDNLAEWERWIYRFDQRGESWKLVDVVPNYTFEDAELQPRRRQFIDHYHLLQDIRTADSALLLEDGGYAGLNTAELHSVGRVSGRDGGVSNGASGVAAVTASLRSSIGKEYYDLILIRCLERNFILFNGAVHHFQGLFNVDIVLKATKIKYDEICENNADSSYAHPLISPRLPLESASQSTLTRSASPMRHSETQKVSLCEAYVFLLQLQGRNDEALQVLLLVSSSTELINFVRQAKVYHKALEILPELFSRSHQGTIELLLEHAKQTHAFPSLPSSVVRPASPDPSSSSITSFAVSPSAPLLTPGPSTEGADPLCPESVVKRLEGCERRFLWLYLHALRESNKTAFAVIAKRHAQLIATLYIEYDRTQLLPFLREMCMYVERIKNICALCKKYGLLDEMVFLMVRIGRGEEGLRVIVRQMNNITKAVQFIIDVPSKEDQTSLFKRLVELVVEYNASLPLNADGQRYILHETQPGDTYATIARQYDLDENTLRMANHQQVGKVENWPSTSGNADLDTQKEGSEDQGPFSSPVYLKSCSEPFLKGDRDFAPQPPTRKGIEGVDASCPPNPCVVPLQLLSSLLKVAADPNLCANNPIFDAAYIIGKLPNNEYIEHASEYIAAVMRSRSDNKEFLSSIMQVAMSDLVGYHGELLKRRTAAVRVAPGNTRCFFCRQNAAQQGIVAFGCGHTYHSSCVLSYLTVDDVLNTDLSKVDPQAFFEHPQTYSKVEKNIPYCNLCAQSYGGLQRH